MDAEDEAFDWDAWVDMERQAAEERTGAPAGGEAALSDPRYGRVLDIWSRRERALRSIQEATTEARRMAGGRP